MLGTPNVHSWPGAVGLYSQSRRRPTPLRRQSALPRGLEFPPDALRLLLRSRPRGPALPSQVPEGSRRRARQPMHARRQVIESEGLSAGCGRAGYRRHCDHRAQDPQGRPDQPIEVDELRRTGLMVSCARPRRGGTPARKAFGTWCDVAIEPMAALSRSGSLLVSASPMSDRLCDGLGKETRRPQCARTTS